MCGIKQLSEEIPGICLQYPPMCCEAFQQLIFATEDQSDDYFVIVIYSYKAMRNMDHIIPGFVLCSLTSVSLIEVPAITLQMIHTKDTSP